MIDIDKLIKEAILTKNSVETTVFRAIKTKITEFKSSKNAKEYNEAAELQLLNKMRKERLDSAKQYREAGRSDLELAEIKEVEVLDKLLPAVPTEDDIKEFLTTHFMIPSPKREMGNIIKAIKAEMPLADGKMVSEIVKQFLI